MPSTLLVLTLEHRLSSNCDLTRIITLRPLTHGELNFELVVTVSICSTDRAINSHIGLHSILSSTCIEKSLKFWNRWVYMMDTNLMKGFDTLFRLEIFIPCLWTVKYTMDSQKISKQSCMNMNSTQMINILRQLIVVS